MPNEIYHRSNFGNPNAEGFGDVYYDHAATNKLYNHSDYYENSDGTDATLKDLNNKASIVLTPTAYSDGSLNTVIPPYGFGSELITNGDFSDGTSNWSASNASIEVVNGELKIYNQTSSPATTSQVIIGLEVGKKYKVTATSRLEGSGGNTARVSFFGNIFAASTSVGQSVTESIEITATVTSATLSLFLYGTSSTEGYFDNISVKEIQEADFDFSRGSSATRVNEQGLVEDVQILSGELVQNGNFEQIGAEEVTNGNFDTDTDWSKGAGWTISGGKAVATNTSSFFKQNSVVTNNKIYKVTFNATVDSGRFRLVTTADAGTYTSYITADGSYTFYMKPTVSINGGFEFVGDGYTGTIDNVSVKEVGQNWSFGTGWSMGDGKALFDSSGNAGYLTQSGALEINKKYKLTATVNSGIVSLVGAFYDVEQGQQIQTGVDSIFTVKSANGSVLRLYSHPNDGDAEITDIKVVEITDDTDLPRIDFTDGTGSLLLEPQRTNLITYSEDFSNSVWIKNNSTVSLSSISTPNGDLNSYKLVESNTNSSHGITYNNSSTSNMSFSVFAKSAERTFVQLQAAGIGNTDCVFDLSNGTILIEESNATANIEDYGNGWYRCSLSYSSSGVNNSVIKLYNGGDSYQGDGSSGLYIWGAQLEAGSYATSYIPTSGSTVTRSADVANNSGNADLFNDSEGVLYAEIAALADDQTYREIAISDGTSNNRIEIRYTNTSNTLQSVIRSGGTVVMLESTSSYNITNFNKIAVSYKANEFKMYVNSTEVAVDTSGNAPTALNTLRFDDGNGANDFYGDVKCVAVFKEALNNDLLERLTGEGYESFRLLAEANNYTII